MDTVHQNELDQAVRRLREAGDLHAAASLILSTLGPDVLRIVYARFQDPDHTAEVFARFSEALWRALPSFAFRCSVRAFTFTLAKHTGSRYLARELKPARCALPLSQAGPLAQQVEALRTRTLTYLRTESRDRVARLRASLSDEDQLLLTLRIDRQLEFREVAVVMLEDPDACDAEITRAAARLRKRLQLIKQKLRRQLSESE